MARLPPMPTVRELLKLYNLRAMKSLSQNFLLDSRVTDRIVKVAGVKGGEVCEVGPGPGSITRSIIKRNPSKLILVEKDRRFLPSLQMLAEAAPCHMDVVLGDVMSHSLEASFSEAGLRPWTDRPPNIQIVGNLPFNISTPLIIRWLHAIAERRGAWRYGRVVMTLTFQKEVAERITAPILSKQRCRMSVMCQNWCSVSHKFTIGGSAFIPKPKVDVGVVVFEPLIRPIIDLPFKLVEKVTRSIFSFRQKYCIRGVETLFPSGLRDEYGLLVMKNADIDPHTRPVMLTVSEIGRIAHVYADIIAQRPELARYNYRAPVQQVFDEDDGPSELPVQLIPPDVSTDQPLATL